MKPAPIEVVEVQVSDLRLRLKQILSAQKPLLVFRNRCRVAIVLCFEVQGYWASDGRKEVEARLTAEFAAALEKLYK